jgi:hypothetical protein
MNGQRKIEKLNFKGLFISEDGGETFLCIRQFFVSDLETGEMLNGKHFQGKKFKMIKGEKDGRKEI